MNLPAHLRPAAADASAGNLLDMVRDVGAELGLAVDTSSEQVRAYIASRMLHLSSVVGEPGYLLAVRKEAANVFLESVGRAFDVAVAADVSLWNVVVGGLVMAARLLA